MKIIRFREAIWLLHIIIMCCISGYSQELHLGDQIWQSKNLTVSHFRNGDTIFYAQTLKQWNYANENHIPAWCYYGNKRSNKTRDKLYNWYAVIDSRNLAPKGWAIPTYQDFESLKTFYLTHREKQKKKRQKSYLKRYKKLKRKLKRTSNDSLFIANYSSYIDNIERNKVVKDLPGSLFPDQFSQKALQKLEKTHKGDVIGPYLLRDNIYLAKVVGFKNVQYASMQCILLEYNETKSNIASLLEKAKKIVDTIREKHNFTEMVKRYSADPPAKENLGVYKMFSKDVMTKNITHFVFSNPVGSIGIVETSYGVMIITVLKRKTRYRPVVNRYKGSLYFLSFSAPYFKGKNWSTIKQKRDKKYNFGAFPTGFRYGNGEFIQRGYITGFWFKKDNKQPLAYIIRKKQNVPFILETPPSFGFSIRCIKK